MQREWARKRLADFNLWATSSGASGEELASLDQRLASKPSVKNVIVNLLCLLQGLLLNCQLQGDPNATHHPDNSINSTSSELDDSSESDDSDSTEEGPATTIPLSKAFGDIGAIINQLVRISIAIRRAGTQARLDRADRSFDSDRHNELRDFLVLLVYANALTSNQKAAGSLDIKPNPHCLTEVQSQLILANLRRRHRFLYAEKRWKKQAKEREAPVFIQIIPENTLSDKKSTHLGKSPENREYQDPQTQVKPTIAPTWASTYPTIVQEPIVMPQGSQPSMTTASATSVKVAYPKAPQIPVDCGVFICPCCYLTLPRSVLQGHKWRKHLAEDILPYTCILDQCPQPLQLYSSRADWMQHMTNDHPRSQYWLCFACSHPVKFPEEKDFVSHLQIEHSEVISNDQIPMFVSDCACTVPLGISHCPLCPLPSPDAEDNNHAIIDHIAEHVHSFSLNSLPWPTHGVREREYVGSDNDPDEHRYFDNASNNVSVDQTRSSISEGSLQLYAVEDGHIASFDEPKPDFDSQDIHNPALDHLLIEDQGSFQQRLDDVERQLLEALEMRDQETAEEMVKLAEYYKAKMDELDVESDHQNILDPQVSNSSNEKLADLEDILIDSVTEPAKWVCQLTTFWGRPGEEGYAGAGFLVNVPDSVNFCILTAGHNIVNLILGQAEKIQVNFPSGLEFIVGPSEWYVSKVYGHKPTSNSKDESSLMNYGLIVTNKEKHLASNPGLEDPGGCGFDIFMQDIDLLNTDITVYSYALEARKQTMNVSQLNYVDKYALYYSMMQEGVGGGAVIISMNGMHTAVGIHNYHGRATRLTTEVMFEILSWIDDYPLRRVLEVVSGNQPKVYLQATDGTQKSIAARPGIAYLNFVLAVAPKTGSHRHCQYVILPDAARPAQEPPLPFLTLCDDEEPARLMFQEQRQISRKKILINILREGPRLEWTSLCWPQDTGQSHEDIWYFITVNTRKREPVREFRCIIQDDEVRVHHRKRILLYMYPYDPTDNRVDHEDTRLPDLPPLYSAVMGHDSQTVMKLLNEGADASFSCTCDTTALSKACENGDLAIVNALFQNGASIETNNIDGESPEMLSRRNGHIEVVNQLQVFRSKLIESLLYATEKGSINDIRALLKRGVVLNPRNISSIGGFNGKSALDIAVRHGHQDTANFLLREAKVAAIEADEQGVTALHNAALVGDATVIKYLLDFGADVNAVSKTNLTPLHCAAEKGNVAAISALCDDTRIDLNSRGRYEATPLILAAQNGHADAVERLIELSVDTKLMDSHGETAKDKARKQGRLDIYNILH